MQYKIINITQLVKGYFTGYLISSKVNAKLKPNC